jgi:tetratricopeptide (TPR) repeat protein
MLAEDPLRILPRVVQAELGAVPWPEAAKTILAHCGEDSFAVLEAAYAAADLGVKRAPFAEGEMSHWAPAASLLRACIEVPDSAVANDPQAYMLLAYLDPAFKTHADSANLRRAAKLSTDYVFPSRPESLPVLKYAAAQDDEAFTFYFGYEWLTDVPKLGCFQLYLGNLYAGLGRLDEAVAAWEKAVALDDSLSVAHRNLGVYAWKKQNELTKAAAHFEKALAARPSDQILYRDYANVLIAQDKRPDAIALLERSPQEPSRRGDLTTLLAQAYLDEKNYDATLSILGGKAFSNWEGNATTWNIFHRAHLDRGKQRLDAGDASGALEDFEASLSYPEALGVGRPADPEEAESYYWKGRTLAALNRADEARKAWETAAGGREGSAAQNEYRTKSAEALSQ